MLFDIILETVPQLAGNQFDFAQNSHENPILLYFKCGIIQRFKGHLNQLQQVNLSLRVIGLVVQLLNFPELDPFDVVGFGHQVRGQD